MFLELNLPTFDTANIITVDINFQMFNCNANCIVSQMKQLFYRYINVLVLSLPSTYYTVTMTLYMIMYNL